MVTDQVIEERLAKLREYVDDLRGQQGISFSEYQGNKIIRRYIEHTLQVALEACLDIGHHIIAEKHLPLPKEHRDIFAVLAANGVLPARLVPSLQKMVGFRNLLVHEYEKVDKGLVYGILGKNLDDFDGFRRAVYQYLDTEAKTGAGGEQASTDDASTTTLRERRAAYSSRRKRQARSK